MKNTILFKTKEKILIIFVIIIALFGLFGWSTGELFFAQLSILYIPIAPSTALSFLLLSIIMLVQLQGRAGKTIYLIGQFLISIVIAFSIIVIYEWIFNSGWDIENIFVKNPEAFDKVVIGRMSPLTAILFIIEGFAIAIYSLMKRKRNKTPFGLLVFTAFFISSILLVGYLYNTPLLYGGATIPVALPTAICFWLISVALLLVIKFNFWPFSTLTGNSFESQLTKAFLPVILFLVILNNYLQSNVLTNSGNPALISAIVLIIAIPLMGFVIISISKKLGKSLKKAQQTIQETEQRFNKAITHAPFPIMIHSNGKVIKLSNSWTKITGYTIDDIPTISEWTKKAYGENAVPLQNYTNKMYTFETAQYNGEWQIRTSNGSTHIWEFMTSPIGQTEKGEKIFSSMAVDVTERKLSEIELNEKNEEIASQNEEYRQINEELYSAKERAEENEEKYKILYNNTPVLLHSSDLEGKIVSVNDYWLKTLGYEHDEVIGTKARDYLTFQSQESYKTNIKELIEKGWLNNIEARAVKKNGEIIDILVSSKMLYDIEGNPIQTMTNIIDITFKKNAEKQQELLNQQLIIAKEKAEESDSLKTSFLQNMSHEIRTPMNAIIGFSKMLDKPGLSDEKRKSFTSIIVNSTNQLLSVVNDILTISAVETKQEKVNITEVVINTIIVDLFAIFKTQAHNQNISLYTKQLLTDKQSEIFTDKTKLTQILTNLITNALKFTHQGFIEFGYETKDDKLLFYVKDSGIGIKSEMQAKIFERFRQADLSINKKYGGTGLGLAISKSFVELLGGEIWVESESGKGAAFYFTVPYKPVNKPDNTITLKRQTNTFKTILVAEDDEFNFLFIEELLIDLDLKIIHAKNGQEAINFCNSNPEIDLILMDIKMPVVDGYTAAKLIKESRPGLPIIAQSAYALEQEVEKYSDVFDDYLTKPIHEHDLVQKIMKYI